LRGGDWYVVTDIPEKYIGPIFKGQEVQAEILYFLTYEERTDKFPRIVCKRLPTYTAQNPIKENGL
jgi:hypothetical protein